MLSVSPGNLTWEQDVKLITMGKRVQNYKLGPNLAGYSRFSMLNRT